MDRLAPSRRSQQILRSGFTVVRKLVRGLVQHLPEDD